MSARPETSPSPAQMQNRGLRRPRRALPYLSAVLLVCLIVAGLWPRPAQVETAKVGLGPLQASINEEGKTRIKQRYIISAPVPGQLRRIALKAGTSVRAGETLLAVIDPVAPTMLDARAKALAEARVGSAQANLEKAQAEHRFAVSELKRFELLARQNTISPQEADSARLKETAAARDAEAATSALRQAQAELAEFSGSGTNTVAVGAPTEIRASVDGKVLTVFEESSRVVAAGTPLLELGNPTNLEVVIEVLSQDGASIPPGCLVEFDNWGGAKPLEGRIRLVEPAAFTKVSALGVEEQRVNAVADLLTPPEQRANVGDNFRVEARIITWQSDKVLKVPAGALFRQGAKWAAFVNDNSHARLRTVSVGHASTTETEVLAGLHADDEVILYPGNHIKEGDRVRRLEISR